MPALQILLAVLGILAILGLIYYGVCLYRGKLRATRHGYLLDFTITAIAAVQLIFSILADGFSWQRTLSCLLWVALWMVLGLLELRARRQQKQQDHEA